MKDDQLEQIQDQIDFAAKWFFIFVVCTLVIIFI